MSDRLAEIKEQWGDTATDDGLWLIEKVERLRVEVDKAWRAATDQGAEASRLRVRMFELSEALHEAAFIKVSDART